MDSGKKDVPYSFTNEEKKRFVKRWENGYDLTTDEKYNHWLKRYHPVDFKKLMTNKSKKNL